ncbi:MAG TPA: hypothetical protein VGD43_01390 [Micromonospora sp.]
MSVRQDLADAVTTVDGVKCTPYYVSHSKPGAAFVRLDRIEYPNRFGGVAHWNVVLILPQDLADAERFLEAKHPLIKAAVEEHLVVTSITPQQLQVGTGAPIPCAFINGHREE